MKEKPSRTPIPDDPVMGFQMMVCILSKQMGIERIPELSSAVSMLSDACDRYVFDRSHKRVPSTKKDTARRQFIAIWKIRYLQFTDYEDNHAVTQAEMHLVGGIYDALSQRGFTVDEYLKWYFENFLSENSAFCPPRIQGACSNFVFGKFEWENREVIQRRREHRAQKEETLSLIEKARLLIRTARDHQRGEFESRVKKSLTDLRDGCIVLGEFRKLIFQMQEEASAWKQKEGKQ